MANLDSQQVQLKLTSIPYILAELRKKHRLTRNQDNEEVFNIQFDSKTIEFKKDRIVTVGKQVADCLIADAFVIVGPPIDGVVEPVLEIVREFNLSDGESAITPTTCLYCKEEQGSARNLAQHLITEHSDDDEAADNDEAAKESGHSHTPARESKSKKAAASGEGIKNADSN